MSLFRSRILWFSAGYWAGSRYSGNPGEAISNILKDGDPCTKVIEASKQAGLIVTPEEGERRRDQCDRAKTMLSALFK